MAALFAPQAQRQRDLLALTYPIENPDGGDRVQFPEDPFGGGGTTGGDMSILLFGGDGLMPEEPSGKGSRGAVVSLLHEHPGHEGDPDPSQPTEAPGGAGSDLLVATLTMLLPVWPDEDASKGGKVYPSTTPRNIAEVVMCPEEYDGQAPQFPAVDDEDEEYQEEDEEEEGEEGIPTDRPQFVEVAE